MLFLILKGFLIRTAVSIEKVIFPAAVKSSIVTPTCTVVQGVS